jgi:predicted nucleic acid-binding protein
LITADTNIFVYASDPASPIKQATAVRVVQELKRRRSPVAIQVVGELQNVLRRKLKVEARLAAEMAGEVLNVFTGFPASSKAAAAALEQMALGRLSYWDALMLASAREAGCTTFISEDLQDGGQPFGLEVVNPFGEAGPSSRISQVLGL